MRYAKLLLLSWLLLSIGTAALAGDESTPLHLAIISSSDLRETGAEEVISASLDGRIKDGLVDRTQIDKYREELDLAAFCSPSAIGERQALGRAISADMLVILRTEKGSKETLQSESGSQIRVVIVDCRYGVRLADRFFDHAPRSLSKLIPKAIEETYRKYLGGIDQIVGFTPFVPEGEQGRIEQLHLGLPHLLEKIIMQNSSVVVIHSEEALLIERERLVGAIPDTSVPITIVSGSYSVQFESDSPNQVHVAVEVSRQGESRGTFQFVLTEDDYANVALTYDLIDEILAFIGKALEMQSPDAIASSPEQLAATLQKLLEEARRQAQAGEIDEVISIGEATLLLDAKQTDARWLLIGAYRRKLQKTVGYFKIRIINGVRVDASPKAVLRERLRHHGEYLIRNALVDQTQGVRILRVLSPHPVYQSRVATVVRGREGFPTTRVRYTNPDSIRSYLDQALELIEKVKLLEKRANAPEATAYDSDEILRGYALGKMHKNWQDSPNNANSLYETDLWVQAAIDLKDRIHYRASRIDPSMPIERATLDDWAVAFEEEVIRNALTPEELGYFVIRNFREYSFRARLDYLADHPDMRERYRELYKRLTQEASPQLQLSGRLGLFALVYRKMLYSTDMHPPRFLPEPIRETRRHLEPIMRLAIECGITEEMEREGDPDPVRSAMKYVDTVTERALMRHNARPSAIANKPNKDDVPCVTAKPIQGFDIWKWLDAFAIDGETDLICEPKRVCLMSEPGELTPIFSTENRGYEYPKDWIYCVYYDGKLIWIIAGDLELLALDRQGNIAAQFRLPPLGKIWPYSTRTNVRNDFPDKTYKSRGIAPYMTSCQPGQVWLTGVGKNRKSVWVGQASIGDEETAGKFEVVFHAERRASDPSPEAQLPMDVMFYPNNSLRIFDLNEDGQWLVIPRSQKAPSDLWADSLIHSFLWIDVEKPSNVRIDQTTLSNLLHTRGNVSPLYYLDDAIFVAKQDFGSREVDLSRLALAGDDSLSAEASWREELIRKLTREPRHSRGFAWLFDGEKLHYFSRLEWMVIDPQTLEIETFATNFEEMGVGVLPHRPFHNPYFSAHYGLLVPTEVVRDKKHSLELFQISFP